MENLGYRIKIRRKELKISQQTLADKTGVSKTSITYWERGDNTPKHESLVALAKVLNTTTDYLLYGLNNVQDWDSDTKLEDDETEIVFFKDFNLACGVDTIGEALKTESRRLRISKSTLRNMGIESQNCFAVTAYGDSMKSTINDGDTVYIDLGRKKIKDGKIFAVCHGGHFRLKRLYTLPLGGVRIVSDNQDEYPEERLSAEEIKDQEFFIVGWAWSWQRVEFW